MADYICEFAKAHGLEYYRDEVHNVIVKKPASKGCENVPPLMLQGHTDMVCVKLPEVEHDFTKDPLELEIKDGWLTAKGTTLGADDAWPAPTCWHFWPRRTMCIRRWSACSPAWRRSV